ncbi:MAG: acyltransferase family protein [Limisphaerales bacterium]
MNPATPPAAPQSERLVSLDAYRGFVMLLMMAEVLHFCSVAGAFPESGFWKFLCWHQSHVDWVGCSLHDLIQPSFSFIVGVALPFSIVNRMARGQSATGLTLHAFWRALLLVLLGVFLRSTWSKQTNWTFEDTLTQIGLGYGFLFLLGFRSRRTQWIALAVLLVGYWAAFALYPLPGADFDWKTAGASADWEHNLKGFAAHWNKNTNLAWAFDTWFMNLFPRGDAFTHNGGGYSTLSFIPTLATMILGLIAGGILRSDRKSWDKVLWLGVAGCAALGAGWLLGVLGICPVVKRIWTPSWTLFSGGWCLLLLAAFYAVIDLLQFKAWSFPLVVIGMNSIAAYCMAHLFDTFIGNNLRTHLGQDFFKLFGDGYERLFHGAAVLFTLWLILFWMYRRKFFLRI